MASHHDTYVAQGNCSAIKWTKAWCNKPAGHSGPHMAPYLHPDGKQTPVEWNDSDHPSNAPAAS